MRQARKSESARRKPAKPQEPLAEGLMPLKKNGQRDWASMSDGDLIGFAKAFIDERGIRGREVLKKADLGLYCALMRRELIGEVGLEERLRDWAAMSYDGLVSFAKEFIDVREIGGRKELEKADPGLYDALRRRKLLDEVGLADLRGERRGWASMSDGDLARFAEGFIDEREIGGRKELARADAGLYQALRKRKLLGAVGLADSNAEHRDWTAMGKEELVRFGKEFIGVRGIGGKGELARADLGLYSALMRRKLLDAVFSDVKRSGREEAVKQVVEGLEEFGT